MRVGEKHTLSWLVLIVFLAFGTYGCTKKTTSSAEDTSVHKIQRATNAVKDLFVKSDWDHLNTARIKDTTTQKQIDYAAKLTSKIKPKEKNDTNSVFGLGLALSLANAQKQLDERSQKGSTNATQEKSKNEGQKGTEAEQNQQQPPTYIPKKTDVVLKDHVLKNENRLEDFITKASQNNESELRVVKYVNQQGVLIYNLKSRYDKNAKEGWIEVHPDLSHYIKLKNEAQDTFNNAPQQCGSISKDNDHGYYVLKECRTNWEYQLLPIPNSDKG
ncbi:hypothetical protein JOD43_002189 [Pullulanibacillus pueri]|uniref:Uncharacterized protein n=1 Tax=Pullulanibacillus pueri TaxID=1437324 RepID=A0A8J3ERD3_9BACL|nr:hypothetical protein [Pullulanibacillus pueri]MBM7682017.1 hypothetical protein [Pullulanibacillus pueri]GGH88234.1 hypothetical protein GCM10007096_40100 [Pullulanibacillus pueri]